MCFPFHYIFHNSPAQSESRQNDCIPIVSGESREVLLTPFWENTSYESKSRQQIVPTNLKRVTTQN